MWDFAKEVILLRQSSPLHFAWSFAVVAFLGLLCLGLPGAAVYLGWQWLLQNVFRLDPLPELTGDRAWPAVILVSMALGGIYPVLHGCNLLARIPTMASVAIVVAWSLVATLAARLVR